MNAGGPNTVTLSVLSSLSEIAAETWDAAANPEGVAFDPFVSHAFLSALEDSGSATQHTGWAAQHLVLYGDNDQLRGALPLYLKSHSYGEYVFDHSWAAALERAGSRYYPKLQSCIPFTPATGRRFLIADGEDAALTEKQLLSGAVELANRHDASSVHITFPTEAEWNRLGDVGLLQRTDQQFHWHNNAYGSFDEFLSTLASRKRKNLKKERTRALENGVEIEWVTGSDLTESHWDAFFHFYMDTGNRKWGSPYLTREFFSLIGERLSEHTLLIMCKRRGKYIAGALNFIGGDCLFGRNWGCTEHHDFLHFEACYYQAIDFAIEKGLKRVEAGAQGGHKLLRGYMPEKTYSLHWFADPRMRDALEDYLMREREAVDEHISELADHAPFKKTDTPQHGSE